MTVCAGIFLLDSKSDLCALQKLILPQSIDRLHDFPGQVTYERFWGVDLKSWMTYEAATHTLTLARALTALEPLYYLHTDTFFAFSSEISPLLALQEHPPKVDHHGRITTLQYGCTVGSQTIFRGIHRLPAGTTLTLQDQGCALTLETHEHLFSPAPALSLKAFQERIIENLSTVLEPLTQPTSLLLESPADYLLAHGATSLGLNTITLHTVVLEGKSEIAADFFDGMLIQEHPLLEQQFWGLLPAVAATLAEPCSLPGHAIHFYLTSQLPQGTSLLSAMGADLLFGDQDIFRNAVRPPFMGGTLLPKQGLLDPFEETPSFLKDWRTIIPSAIERKSTVSPLQQSQLIAYNQRFLTGEIERALTLTSGINKDKIRFPFLEDPLKSLILNAHDKDKVHHGQGGFAFYDLLRRLFPTVEPSRLRDFKRQTLDGWLRHKGQRLASVVARQEDIEGLFSRDYVREIFSCQTEVHTKAAWALLFFALWHQAHIKGIQPVADTISFLAKRA